MGSRTVGGRQKYPRAGELARGVDFGEGSIDMVDEHVGGVEEGILGNAGAGGGDFDVDQVGAVGEGEMADGGAGGGEDDGLGG